MVDGWRYGREWVTYLAVRWRCLQGLAWLAVACLWSLPLGAAESGPGAKRPLQFGLLPYVSTRKLFTEYGPLKLYLERTLRRRVIMSTAPNFKVYLMRTRRGDYDLYHTAPHFAALAERDWGYRRLARFTRVLDGSFVVARNGGVRRLEDLRGKVVRTPDPLAIITMLGEHSLRQHGLLPGRDVEVRFSPSHNNAVLSVLRGEAAAAVTSAAVFEKMPRTVREQLRILTSTSKVPHMMFMAGPRLSAAEYRALRRALLDYTAAGAGKGFFAATGYGDMSRIEDADMQALAPFLDELAQRSKF
jgi:phosphonate transport system substrate-binding protein